MPKKVMQKGRKMELKWVQNGSQKRSKIGKRRKKGDPKIDAKNGGVQMAELIVVGSLQGRFWSRRAVWGERRNWI